LEENMPGEWGFKCSNKGADPFWGPVRGKIRENVINLQKSSHEPMAGMH